LVIIGIAAINGILFGVEGGMMRVLKDETTLNHMIAGTVAGGIQCVITAPMELVKTRMQVTGIGDAKSNPSLIKTAKLIYKADGIRMG